MIINHLTDKQLIDFFSPRSGEAHIKYLINQTLRISQKLQPPPQVVVLSQFRNDLMNDGYKKSLQIAYLQAFDVF